MNLWRSFLQTEVFTAFKVSPQESRILLEKFPNPDVLRTNKEVADQASEENQLPIDPETVSKQARNAYQKFFLEVPNLKILKGANREKAFQAWLKPKFEEYQRHIQNQFGSNHVSPECDWQKVCREMLQKQQKQWLTTHPLGSGSRRIADMYVPLGLVERKQNEPPRIDPHDAPDRWSVLEQEKTTPIPHEDFLERVLKPGKPIAIIGEAGAGKTTLLQEIAGEFQEEGKGLPIWIDLADLKPEETLESYLLNKWLKDALPILHDNFPDAVLDLEKPSKDLQKSLIEEINQGQVWLLLNGADEMVTAVGQPLRWLLEQYQKGWIAKARVVLTCRLNVWSSDGERLTNVFEVYRNLDFEPEDVEKFIHKWFSKESEQDSLDSLKAELERSNERIKSLIRNPLRLTLLCLTWQKCGDKLPDTKAGLYQRFVDWHYRWNEEKRLTEEERSTLSEQREKLDRQLGELSKFALDAQESRFRLRENTVKHFLGNPKQKSSLFWWALRLNWLTPIGLPTAGEKNADEPVYAFFHPTFQEYFAALAIYDWDDFLPRGHKDKPIENRKGENKEQYRIFKSQWREVVLLWLGQKNRQLELQQKELVEKLLEFKGDCANLFLFQIFFLYAYCSAELGEERLIDEVLKDLANVGFGGYPPVIATEAKKCFKYFDSRKISFVLINLLEKFTSEENILNEEKYLDICSILTKKDRDDAAIFLATFLQNSKNMPLLMEADELLRWLIPDHPYLISEAGEFRFDLTNDQFLSMASTFADASLSILRTEFEQVLSLKPLPHRGRDLFFKVSFTPNFEKIAQSLNCKR